MCGTTLNTHCSIRTRREQTHGHDFGNRGGRDRCAGRAYYPVVSRCKELLTIQLGLQLGLYKALSDHGPSTAAQLAPRRGADERYLLEWLEQQAVAGIIGVEDRTQNAALRRYRLSATSSRVLLDVDSLDYLGPLAGVATALARTLPEGDERLPKRNRR